MGDQGTYDKYANFLTWLSVVEYGPEGEPLCSCSDSACTHGYTIPSICSYGTALKVLLNDKCDDEYEVNDGCDGWADDNGLRRRRLGADEKPRAGKCAGQYSRWGSKCELENAGQYSRWGTV